MIVALLFSVLPLSVSINHVHRQRFRALQSEARLRSDTWQPGNNIACPCDDAALCAPIKGNPVRSKEVYGFVDGTSPMNWSHVTTVAWPSSNTSVCEAHKHGARVVLASPSVVLTDDASQRKAWIQSALQQVQEKFLDGIVFDWESPAPQGSDPPRQYALLISETRDAFHQANPSLQISTCVAWSPDDIDGRGYDMTALSKASDLLYVMDYDTRSQVFDHCIAAANAPLPGTIKGVQRYFDLGVPPQQLVLGVPWYGYHYPCLAGTAANAIFCPIKSVPFRGVNCSDAAGGELAYKTLRVLSQNASRAVAVDQNQNAPFFNVVGADGAVSQYWYDDPSSLATKYAWAKGQGLLGVGPFTYSDLDPIGAPEDARAMWAALDAFF